jgi:hypothetical protein
LGRELVDICSGALVAGAAVICIDICDIADAILAEESCTLIAKPKVPAAAGWPAIIPEAALIPKPFGRAPVAIDQW